MFVFKQKTAYEMRISDWSSDVCSSDLFALEFPLMSHALRRLTCLLLLLVPAIAWAQERPLELDIIGGNAAALPIAVVPMPYQGSATAPEIGCESLSERLCQYVEI